MCKAINTNTIMILKNCNIDAIIIHKKQIIEDRNSFQKKIRVKNIIIIIIMYLLSIICY